MFAFEALLNMNAAWLCVQVYDFGVQWYSARERYNTSFLATVAAQTMAVSVS